MRRFQDKNGRLTSAGKKRYSDDESENEKKFLTDKQKKYIKIGAAAVAASLAVYGGYKLYKSGTFDQMIYKYDSRESAGLFNKKTVKTSVAHDLKAVNPNYDPKKLNEWSMNCGNCAMAFELRRRGYDVKARGNSTGMTISQLGQFFKGLKSESFIQMGLDERSLPTDMVQRGKAVQNHIQSNIVKQYTGDARGMLMFPHTRGNHFISWVKEGDSVKFYDAQDPNYDLSVLFRMYKYHRNDVAQTMTSIRLDDLSVNSSISDMVADRLSNRGLISNFDTFIEKGKDFIMHY